MVEIERTGAVEDRPIIVRRDRGENVELRLGPLGYKGARFVKLAPSEARCVAYLLLAEAEHPTEGGKLVLESNNPNQLPLIVKRTPSGLVELRLWDDGRGPYAEMSLRTTRRVAYAMMVESQPETAS